MTENVEVQGTHVGLPWNPWCWRPSPSGCPAPRYPENCHE